MFDNVGWVAPCLGIWFILTMIHGLFEGMKAERKARARQAQEELERLHRAEIRRRIENLEPVGELLVGQTLRDFQARHRRG